MNSFRQWESGVTPVLHASMAVLNACDRVCESHWTPAVVAHGDQILAASRTIEAWLQENRCPYADLDLLLAGMARSYADPAGCLLAMATEDSAGAWGELAHDLKGVHGSVARVLTAMYQQSLRQV